MSPALYIFAQTGLSWVNAFQSHVKNIKNSVRTCHHLAVVFKSASARELQSNAQVISKSNSVQSQICSREMEIVQSLRKRYLNSSVDIFHVVQTWFRTILTKFWDNARSDGMQVPAIGVCSMDKVHSFKRNVKFHPEANLPMVIRVIITAQSLAGTDSLNQHWKRALKHCRFANRIPTL